jgi:hypothetical protein
VLNSAMGLTGFTFQTDRMSIPMVWACSYGLFEHLPNRNEIRNLKPMGEMSLWLDSSVRRRVMACAQLRQGLNGLHISNRSNLNSNGMGMLVRPS